MASTSSTASRQKRGAVARSSQNGHFKTIKFKGLTLGLPAKTKLRLLKRLTSNDTDELVEALEQLLGEEQMEQVWDIDVDVSKGLDPLADLILELANKVFEGYGTSAGEPGASSQP